MSNILAIIDKNVEHFQKMKAENEKSEGQDEDEDEVDVVFTRD